MAYQFKGNQDGVVMNVEQARRRNAELRIELGALLTENAQIEARVKSTRADLTSAYRKLSRQIRDMDAVNAQAELVAASKRFVSTLPEPKYGGREGLQAATEEMLAYEAKGLKLAKPPRPVKGPSHGTGRRYELGCRCEECEAWKVRKNARCHSNWKRRHREKVAA